jgi:tol-pal system protein YbgF
MESLEGEMRHLRDMIERLQGVEGTSQEIADLRQRVTFIEKQLGIEGSPAPQGPPVGSDVSDGSLAPAAGGEANPISARAPEFTSPDDTDPHRANAAVGDDQIVQVASPELEEDARLYKSAYDAASNERYQEAIELFKRLLKKYPDSEHAANANYWLGEALFNRGLYDESVLQLHKTIKEFPGARKTPNAYLRQGQAFEKMGDKKSARVIFEQLVEKYPHTPQARLARKRIKALKEAD